MTIENYQPEFAQGPVKKAMAPQATPDAVSAQAAQLEAGAKWFRDSGYGDDMKDVLVSFVAAMTGLSQDDVSAYFQDEL